MQKGQKVICIDDRYHPAVSEWADQLPKRGEVYTIREVLVRRQYDTGQLGFGFKFEELTNPGDAVSFALWHY